MQKKVGIDFGFFSSYVDIHNRHFMMVGFHNLIYSIAYKPK